MKNTRLLIIWMFSCKIHSVNELYTAVDVLQLSYEYTYTLIQLIQQLIYYNNI